MDGNDAAGLQPKSELALRAVAMPVFANAHGDIFGGWLPSQMDLAGGIGHPLPVVFSNQNDPAALDRIKATRSSTISRWHR